jgi:hypothetical protein
MRFKVLTLLFFLIGGSGAAQVYIGEERSRGIDSLKLELSNTLDEKKLATVLQGISASYMFVRPDSTIIYANKGLAIARKYSLYEVECKLIRNIGTAHRLLGNTSKALEM